MFHKYFKKNWTLEWKDTTSLMKRLLVMSITVTPFLLYIIYVIFFS